MDEQVEKRLEEQKESERDIDKEKTDMLHGMIFENHFMLRTVIKKLKLEQDYKREVNAYIGKENNDLH